MKKMLFILLLISNVLVGQTKQELILKFVDEHIYEKVGEGICRNLVSEAYKFAGLTDPFIGVKDNPDWRKNFGRLVPSDSVLPGDVICMVPHDTIRGKRLDAHIGIVYSGNKGDLMIANQNYYVKKLKDSIVEIVDIKELVYETEGIYEEVYYFRPNSQ